MMYCNESFRFILVTSCRRPENVSVCFSWLAAQAGCNWLQAPVPAPSPRPKREARCVVPAAVAGAMAMESFEEWARSSAQKPCVQRWADRLVELGASWDSFCRESSETIVSDLVDGGVPILAARDICDIASAAVMRRKAPMALFWDLESSFSARVFRRALVCVLCRRL